MHSKLLASFATIALLGVSAASYASWIKYVEGDGKVPNGDCLETICANGCVENEEFYGYCCPGAGRVGDSCRVDSGVDVDDCCTGGLICRSGRCVRNCPSNTVSYTNQDGLYDCCYTETHEVLHMEGIPNEICCVKGYTAYQKATDGKLDCCDLTQNNVINGICTPKKTCVGCNDCQKCNDVIGQCETDKTRENQPVGECGKCSGGVVVADNSKTAPNICQKCDTVQGRWIADTTRENQPVGECGRCSGGAVVADNNKTAPNACYTCDTAADSETQGQWIIDKTRENQPVGECGKCSGGVVVADNSKTAPNICQKCDTVQGRWIADTTRENQPVGECGKCSGGVVVADNNKTAPNICQKCDTVQGRWIADTTRDEQEVQDACHKCSNGLITLKDNANTVPCGTQCCSTNQECINGRCVSQECRSDLGGDCEVPTTVPGLCCKEPYVCAGIGGRAFDNRGVCCLKAHVPNGQVCNGDHPVYGWYNKDIADSYCCASGLCNNGHCCPSGQFWGSAGKCGNRGPAVFNLWDNANVHRCSRSYTLPSEYASKYKVYRLRSRLLDEERIEELPVYMTISPGQTVTLKYSPPLPGMERIMSCDFTVFAFVRVDKRWGMPGSIYKGDDPISPCSCRGIDCPCDFKEV